MISSFAAGIVFGLSAGLSPGPLLALVISQTLKHNIREGVKVALAPVITDAPIILLTLLVLTKLSHVNSALGAVSLAGGLFVLRLAYESWRAETVKAEVGETRPRSLTRGTLVNALSPHPYLFWLTVGAPAMVKAMNESWWAAAAFALSFYVLLVGSKIALAVIAGKSRARLERRGYVLTMRLLGVALFVFALILCRDGLRLLGLLS